MMILELSRSTYHAEAEIRPHHCDTARQTTVDKLYSGCRQRITYKLCTIVYSVYVVQLHLIWQKCVFLSLPALSTGGRVIRSALHGDDGALDENVNVWQRSFAVS